MSPSHVRGVPRMHVERPTLSAMTVVCNGAGMRVVATGRHSTGMHGNGDSRCVKLVLVVDHETIGAL